MAYQQLLGLAFTFFIAFCFNAAQQGLPPMEWVMGPDWVMLIVLFWGMRVRTLSFIWCVWGVGLLQSALFDDIFGAHSFLYVIGGFIVQHARLRLQVVSVITRWVFMCCVFLIYIAMLNVCWRFLGDGLQWRFVSPFVGLVLGWWMVNTALAPLYPLSPVQDLFEARERQI